MATNQSKKNSPRFWKLWEASGAVGDIYTEFDRNVSSKFKEIVERDGDITIEAIGTNFENGFTTLSLGSVRLGQHASRPEIYIVVPNGDFKIGQKLTKLPKEAKSIERIYGVREEIAKRKEVISQPTKNARYVFELPVEPLNEDLLKRLPKNYEGGVMYIAINDSNYVTHVTEESLLAGLSHKRPIMVSRSYGNQVQTALEEMRSSGDGLHINKVLESIVKLESLKN